MQIGNGTPIEGAGEYAVDFTVAQLVETAPELRRWFLRQTSGFSYVETYVGATVHATYAGEGESDIEFGVVTETGDRHVVLIENKIDAAKQPDQLERYHNRGNFRTAREDWDSFSVCLLAPERYVSDEDRVAVDAVVLYEDVIDQFDGLVHDTAAFSRSVFESAMRKSQIADASETILKIEDRFLETDASQHLERIQAGNKSLIFRSTHPDHHSSIGYNVYIVEEGEGGRTKLRLRIESDGTVTDEGRERIKSVVSARRDALPDYEWMLERKQDIGARTLWHNEISEAEMDEQYIETVVRGLVELVETLHPVFVDADIE